jgi:dihydrofolate reductase
MRRIFAFISTTLDGYYEGPNQEFDFWTVDEDFEQFSLEQLSEVDTLIFGRVTYEGMAAYWPTQAAAADDPKVAKRMNEIAKIVISRTLQTADWTNTRLLRDPDELRAMKRQPGRDMAIFGSALLTISLLGHDLVDEVRVMVNPVAIGAGKSIFTGAPQRIRLKLVESRAFASGNVLQ